MIMDPTEFRIVDGSSQIIIHGIEGMAGTISYDYDGEDCRSIHIFGEDGKILTLYLYSKNRKLLQEMDGGEITKGRSKLAENFRLSKSNY